MKQLIIVTGLLLILLNTGNAQVKFAACSELPETVSIYKKTGTLQLNYPLNMEEAFISCHFGNSFLHGCVFNNETVTFSGKINAKVFCLVDSATVKNIYEEDGVYYVFLEKDEFTIVLYNINRCLVKKGERLRNGQELGSIAADESDRKNGMLELMLFKKNKLLNPENYLKKENTGGVAVIRFSGI
jgi:hypothetical protein